MGTRPSAADAIIVLGGGVTPNGLPTSATERRLQTAIELFTHGTIPYLILSGRWSHNLHNTPARTEAEAMQEAALARGIGRHAIRLEDRSMSTLENIFNCKTDFLAPNHLRHIQFVTDPAYASRTREIGFRVLGADYTFDITTTPLEQPVQDTEIQGLFDFKARASCVTPGDDYAIRQLIELEDANARLRRSA